MDGSRSSTKIALLMVAVDLMLDRGPSEVSAVQTSARNSDSTAEFELRIEMLGRTTG